MLFSKHHSMELQHLLNNLSSFIESAFLLFVDFPFLLLNV